MKCNKKIYTLLCVHLGSGHFQQQHTHSTAPLPPTCISQHDPCAVYETEKMHLMCCVCVCANIWRKRTHFMCWEGLLREK